MNKFRQLPLIFLLALLSLSGLALPSVVGQAAVAAPSQKAGASEILELELDSKLMGREMPYRVVLPTGYKERSALSSRYPVIYLLHGLTGHYKDWTDKTKIAEYNSRFDFIIVTPEG